MPNTALLIIIMLLSAFSFACNSSRIQQNLSPTTSLSQAANVGDLSTQQNMAILKQVPAESSNQSNLMIQSQKIQTRKSVALSTIEQHSREQKYINVIQNADNSPQTNFKHTQKINKNKQTTQGFSLLEPKVGAVIQNTNDPLNPLTRNKLPFAIAQGIVTANMFDKLFDSLISRNNSASPTNNNDLTNITNITVQPNITKKQDNYSIDFATATFDDNVTSFFEFTRTLGLKQALKIISDYKEYLRQFKPRLLKRTQTQQGIFRESVYNTNRQLINTHNQKVLRSYNMGLNSYTDVQQSEFSLKFNKLFIPDEILKQSLLEQAYIKNASGVPVYSSPPRIIINWTCLTTDVISQGACGASYAIAALQSTVMTLKMYNQTAFFLSIQEVISCGSNGADLNGCIGGYFSGAFTYISKFGVGQSIYYFYDQKAKYEGVVSECNKTIIQSKSYTKNKVFIKQSKRVKFGDCEQMIKQLRFRVLTVAVAGDGLQFYTDGIFETNSTYINHGVTLIGYHPDKKYLIKNSWGRTWGNVGYGFVGESTGICNYAMYPVLNQEVGTPQLCSSQV